MIRKFLQQELGISLIEIMIALTLGSFVVGGVFKLILMSGQAQAALTVDDISADLRAHLQQFSDSALGAGSGSEPGAQSTVKVCQLVGGSCQTYNPTKSLPLCTVMTAMQLPPGYLDSGTTATSLSGLLMRVRAFRLNDGNLQFTELGPVAKTWSDHKALCETDTNWSNFNDSNLYTVSDWKLCNHVVEGKNQAQILSMTLRNSAIPADCESVIDSTNRRFRGWFMNVTVKPNFATEEDQVISFPNLVIFQNETRVETF